MVNSNAVKVFDRPCSVYLAEERKNFLKIFLPQLIKDTYSKTALDVGCGFGYFAGYLKELSLDVTAFDGRLENVTETKIRNPDVNAEVRNIEDLSISKSGQFDVVTCFGLLYHLENPFCAIRSLSSLTRKICIIETVISPYSSPLTALIEEGEGQDQGLNYVAQIPSKSWIIKVLYKAGFPFVYETIVLPNHQDFHSSLFKRKKRTFVVATKEKVSHRIFKLASEPIKTNQYMWDSFRLGHILEHEGIRKTLKKGVKLFRRSL